MILDGKKLAQKCNITTECWATDLDRPPQLAIITIGEDDASKVYVKNKLKTAENMGFIANNFRFSEEQYFNNDVHDLLRNGLTDYDGIILQLPVPKYVNARELIELIPPEKDVDGLTHTQAGMLQHKEEWTHIPCTPQGILWLLGEYIGMNKLRGKHALIINRSDLVGRPLSQLLLNYDMTVTICHSKTPKQTILREFSTADVVVSAAGVQNLITEDDAYQYFKDNRNDFYGDFANKRDRIIIDVSINRDENSKLCGDFSEAFKQKYSEHYTPVPGGVGPMTVAALIHNTYEAAVWREKYVYGKEIF